MAYGSHRSRPPGTVLRRPAKRGETFIARWTVRDPDGTKRQKSRSFSTEPAAWKHLRQVEADHRAAAQAALRLVQARKAKRNLSDFVEEAELCAFPSQDDEVVTTLGYLPADLFNALLPSRSDSTDRLVETFTAVCKTLVGMAHESIAAQEVATEAIRTMDDRIVADLERLASVRAGGCLDNPTGFFVYCLWGDETERPLYVGQSSNLFARLGFHFGDREKCAAMRRVSLVRCDSESAMLATELKLIRRYQPPWNTVGVLREML